MSRIFSNKTIEFTIEGRPYMRGAPPGWPKARGSEPQEVTATMYKRLVKMAAKMAVCEQGWDITKDDPIYIIISVNVLPIKHKKIRGGKYQTVPDEEKIKNEMATHEPRLRRITDLLLSGMYGEIYKSVTQVVGLFVVKRYHTKEGIGIFAGVARDWRTLTNDLRNA